MANNANVVRMRQSLENEEIIIIISITNFPSQSLLISKGCLAFRKWLRKSSKYECLGWLIALIYLRVTSNIKLWIMHNSVSSAERGWGRFHETNARTQTRTAHRTSAHKQIFKYADTPTAKNSRSALSAFMNWRCAHQSDTSRFNNWALTPWTYFPLFVHHYNIHCVTKLHLKARGFSPAPSTSKLLLP